MAASRKLQGEIDRCLKKVSEGVEQFEDIWKKVHNATNSNQKEKYEADLKKEIKKLQRLRDQIKSWLQSGEIKDKTQLLENRKLIETQMERFKVVERETKTKAYSKEGLGAAQNKDPAQREREETNRWLSESIDTLNIQVDQFESEIESLMAAGKKKKIDKEKSDRVDDLRDWLEKHRFHIKKLEILMRMLNNESIDCDQIKKIKEDVEYYIESSQDPDYVENDGVYDDIDMEDLDYPTPEITQPVIGSHESTDGSTPSSSVCGSSPAPSPAATNNHSNDHVEGQPQAPSNFSSSSSSSHHERKRSNKSDDSRSGSTPVKPQVVRPSNTTSNSTSSNSLPNHSAIGNKATPPPSTPTKPVSGTTSQSTPNNSSSSSGLMNHLSFPSQLNNRESSHGNSSNSNINNTNSSSNSSSNSSNSSSSNNNSSNSSSNNNSNSIIHNSINSHTISSLTTSSISSTNSHSNTNGPVSCGTSSNTSSSSGSNINSTITSNSTISHPATGGSGPTLNSSGSANAVTTSSISNQLLGSSGNSFDSGVSLKAMAQKKLNEVSSTSTLGHESSGANLASSISTNTSSITSVTGSINSVIANSQSTSSSLREKGSTSEAHIPPLLGVAPLGPVHLSSEHKLQYGRLQSAYFHMPHPSDSERFRLHFPRQPCQTPSYYPQVPPPMSDTVEFFQRLSTETLFFIFYYMEGTKAQYLAAKALKKQSWRFHTKHMMWFQRHEEPKAITDEFEQGTYVFFDYENWGQRKWENFIFEYRYLEDRDLN